MAANNKLKLTNNNIKRDDSKVSLSITILSLNMNVCAVATKL